MRSLIAAIAILIATPCHADTWVMLTGQSYHWTRSPDQNEKNYGLFLDHGISERGSVVIGSYRNSQNRMSSVATVGLTTVKGRIMGLSAESRLLFGAVTGYGKTEAERGNTKLIVVPVWTLRGRDVGVIVTGIPWVLVGVGIEVRLP
mgnify:CR=1 FL=1